MMRLQSLQAFLLTLLLSFAATVLHAEGELTGLVLAKAPIDRHDMESVKRGGKFFATTCMTCHTMVYMRYDKLAQDAGVLYEKMPINVTTWPNNVRPPDLSLEASVRGVDWIYTYLHSFYTDTTTATGVNNLVFPNTAMPDIVAPYQGQQTLVEHPMHDWTGHVQWYDAVQLVQAGSMKPEEFDQLTADITNFLAYASEPFYQSQHTLGYWVIGFLCILFVFMYLLKREYWKDIKRHKKD
jgi:ubiquinol-cytochrome c reductase cytochrome c1 subunit